MKHVRRGFTLVELMIVVVVVSILVMLAYPSYVDFVRKSERSDAQTTLLDWANREHLWRADHISYNADINPANTDRYTYVMSEMTATSFTLRATAQGGQAGDEEDGTDCGILEVDESGLVRTPAACWSL